MRFKVLGPAAALLMAAAPALPAQVLHEVTTFTGHALRVDRAVVSPDGRLVAAGGRSRGGEFELWDPATGKEARALAAGMNSLCALAFSPDGRRLAAAGSGPVRVWDVGSGKPLATLGSRRYGEAALAFGPDGRRLAVAGYQETSVWDVDSGKELASFQRETRAWQPQSLAFSGDLSTLAAPNYQEVDLWDTAAGRRAWLSEHLGKVCCLAYSPDGKTLVAASSLTEYPTWRYRGDLRLWDVASGKERAAFTEGLGEVTAAALSADGKTLALLEVVGLRAPPDLKLLDVATGRRRVLTTEAAWALLSVRFTSDGRLLVTGTSEGMVRLWEVDLRPGEGK